MSVRLTIVVFAIRHQIIRLDPKPGLLKGLDDEKLLCHPLFESALGKLSVEVFWNLKPERRNNRFRAWHGSYSPPFGG